MGFHTLYVMPDDKTVIAGVPLTDLSEQDSNPPEMANSISTYKGTLSFLSDQLQKKRPDNGNDMPSPLEQRMGSAETQN
jgi:hypothetical protein